MKLTLLILSAILIQGTLGYVLEGRQNLPSVQDIFKSYDKDGNGCLTKEEVSIPGGFEGCLEFQEVMKKLSG